MVSPDAAERFLNAPLMVEADPATREALLNVLVESRARAGTSLIRQGQPNDHLTFLIGGTVKVSRKFPGGRTEDVATVVAPSVFGETSFFRAHLPIASVTAVTDVWMLTMDRHAHDLLRRADPRAAEQLALSAVRVLAERFDLLDRRVSDYLAQHPEGHDDHQRANEWSRFRARLFEESSL